MSKVKEAKEVEAKGTPMVKFSNKLKAVKKLLKLGIRNLLEK